MTHEELTKKLRELDRLYAEHAQNQKWDNLEMRNRLHRELHDRFLVLKPYIKGKTQLQWYEPTYNYAITGSLDYIESVRNDLAYIIGQYTNSESSEK